MTQYNTLNIKFCNSRLNILKLVTKYGTEVTLNYSLNMISNSNDETNFPRNLILTDKQVWRLCKAFANSASGNTKLSNTHLSKIGKIAFNGKWKHTIG